MWNGTVATLKPNPISISAMPDEEQRARGEVEHGDAPGDQREVRRAGRAVHQRDAVEQERRRERAEQEVLERALGGSLAAAVDAGERVHRDRHQLDAEEDDHQVARGGEQHHARRREQDQHVRLGRLDPRAHVVVHAQRDREHRPEQDDDVDEPAEIVERDRARGRPSIAARPLQSIRRMVMPASTMLAMPTRALMLVAVGAPARPR